MEDLIKREKLFEHIKAVCLEGDGGALITSEDILKMAIKDIPSAETKGEWLHVEGRLGLECSKCGKMCNEITLCEDMVTKANWKYCPQCGSRMKGADDATSD